MAWGTAAGRAFGALVVGAAAACVLAPAPARATLEIAGDAPAAAPHPGGLGRAPLPGDGLIVVVVPVPAAAPAGYAGGCFNCPTPSAARAALPHSLARSHAFAERHPARAWRSRHHR